MLGFQPFTSNFWFLWRGLVSLLPSHPSCRLLCLTYKKVNTENVFLMFWKWILIFLEQSHWNQYNLGKTGNKHKSMPNGVKPYQNSSCFTCPNAGTSPFPAIFSLSLPHPKYYRLMSWILIAEIIWSDHSYFQYLRCNPGIIDMESQNVSVSVRFCI